LAKRDLLGSSFLLRKEKSSTEFWLDIIPKTGLLGEGKIGLSP
jgi:hypothetical protein